MHNQPKQTGAEQVSLHLNRLVDGQSHATPVLELCLHEGRPPLREQGLEIHKGHDVGVGLANLRAQTDRGRCSSILSAYKPVLKKVQPKDKGG